MKPDFRKNNVRDGLAERVGGTDGQECQIQLPEIWWLEHSGSASVHQAQFTFRGASIDLPFFFRLSWGTDLESLSCPIDVLSLSLSLRLLVSFSTALSLSTPKHEALSQD